MLRQRLSQKMKRDKKSLPGSQKRGKSVKLKRRTFSSFDCHIMDCNMDMSRLEREKERLEELIKKQENMEMSSTFTCSLCQLNIESSVRAVCTICMQVKRDEKR